MQPKEISDESKRPRLKGLEGKEVINRDYREQSVNIGITLTKMTRQELIELLKKYKHVYLTR